MARAGGGGWISSEGVRRAKSAVAVALSFVILLGGLGFVGWKGYGLYMGWVQKEDYVGDGDQAVQVYIPAGTSVGRMADILVAADVIKGPTVFEDAAVDQGVEGSIQSGTFNLKTHLPAATALSMLIDPTNKVVVRLTIKEGARLDQIEAQMIDQLGVTQDQIDTALATIAADPAGNGLNTALGMDPAYPEGFFFPDTYNDDPHDALVPLQRMIGQFNSVASEIDLVGGAANLSTRLGFEVTPLQVVTVASIIEAEVNQAEYRPMVARAIYNRIAQGRPLQIESMFLYDRLRAHGTPYTDPVMADTQTDPNFLDYNPYIDPGFPPTPMGNPGREALTAALNPTDGDQIFWTTINFDTGETRFAATEEENEANVALFHQWCSENGNPTGCE